MTKFTLSVGSWTKIASAGSTVEVQGQYVFLTQSATVPTSSTDAETLYGSDDYRKYDAPLPLDLYASFSYSGPSSSTLTGSVEVLPIGAAGGGGTVQDTAADTALGTPADQPPAGPTTSGSVIAKLGGIWIALLGTLKVQIQNTNVPVTGTFWQETQPASISDGGSVTLGLKADAAVVNPASSASLIAIAKGILSTLLGPLKSAIQSNAPRVTATAALTAAGAAGASPAAGSALTLAVDGFSAAIVQLTGTWAGTVAWFASVDGGATFFPVNMIPYIGGAAVGSTTGNGQWEFACGGLTHIQAVMTGYTSGSATALIAAATGSKSIRVGNPAANPLTVMDGNNAAFSSASAMTSGTTYAAARSIGVNCTMAGSLVLTLAGGGTITLPISPGWQIFPFAATAFTFGSGGAGSVTNLS